MRKLGIAVTAIACLMVAAVTFAADAPVAGPAKGQMEIGLMGGMAVPSGKLAADVELDADGYLTAETGVKMKLGFGGGLYFDYFVTPMFAIGLDGGYVTMANQDDSAIKANTMQYGIHGKYVIPTGGPLVPYLQIGCAGYGQKLEDKVDGIAESFSGNKFGFNGGVGVGFKVSPAVAIGVNGFYHMAGKFEPEVDGTKVELLKDWNYMTFNAVVTFTIPKAK